MRKTEPLPAWIALAERMADAAGEIARRYFRQRVTVETKADASPVSQADREIESALRALLAAEVPDHAILGEEEGGDIQAALQGWAWVIDPIDGTRAFLAGVPTFGTLIALCWQGVPVLGILDQPIARERWLGVQGRPTTLNGTAVRTRPCATVQEATFSTTSPFLFAPAAQPMIEAIIKSARSTIFGKDCYAYALLASGFIDLVIESGLKAHDVMALIPIIEGAGGVITTWNGNPLTIGECSDIIACGDTKILKEIRASF